MVWRMHSWADTSNRLNCSYTRGFDLGVTWSELPGLPAVRWLVGPR